jgi:hypothetical protein
MRSVRLVVVVYLCFVLVLSTSAQQSATALPQAYTFLQSALMALRGSTPIADITLSGTAHYIAGSDDETGIAVLKAIPGASRIDLSLSSGSRSEIWNIVSGTPSGTWSGPDGVSHPISYHNLLLIDPAWFFPVFSISCGLAAGYSATYLGHETYDGQAVEHVSVVQQVTGSVPDVALLQHLSEINFYLDSTTLLPVALAFNIHPDGDALLDLPVEVRFSDYRSVNGVQVPFQIQKFLNNSLILDLQFQSVSLNTGLSATSFSVGAAL